MGSCHSSIQCSYINENQNLTNRKGYNTSLNFGETSGKFRNSFGAQYVSDDWDNNDLGINFQTNYYSFYTNTSYRILNPTKIFNSFRVLLSSYIEFNNLTNEIQQNNFGIDINTTSRKNHYVGMGYNIKPYDIF